LVEVIPKVSKTYSVIKRLVNKVDGDVRTGGFARDRKKSSFSNKEFVSK
jgi:hypothetical protein